MVNPAKSSETQAKMEMLLMADDVFENKVKIYDYAGNFVSELNSKAVVENEITVTEYVILESSDFAFEYLGDFYYFRE